MKSNNILSPFPIFRQTAEQKISCKFFLMMETKWEEKKLTRNVLVIWFDALSRRLFRNYIWINERPSSFAFILKLSEMVKLNRIQFLYLCLRCGPTSFALSTIHLASWWKFSIVVCLHNFSITSNKCTTWIYLRYVKY